MKFKKMKSAASPRTAKFWPALGFAAITGGPRHQRPHVSE